jgi:hypothetical protein
MRVYRNPIGDYLVIKVTQHIFLIDCAEGWWVFDYNRALGVEMELPASIKNIVLAQFPSAVFKYLLVKFSKEDEILIRLMEEI